MPLPIVELVTGNAYTDGAPRNGWFVGSFIERTFGARCRDAQHPTGTFPGDFELKLKRHHPGDMERGLFPRNNTATSMSMLIGGGRFEMYFCSGRAWEHVTLTADGDYALWAPNVGHLWMVAEASAVFTVRVPAFPGDQEQTPLADLPRELRRFFDPGDLDRRERERIEGIARRRQVQAGA